MAQLVSESSVFVFSLALGNVVHPMTGSLLHSLNSLAAHIGGLFIMSGIEKTTRVSTMSLAVSRMSRQLQAKQYDTILR